MNNDKIHKDIRDNKIKEGMLQKQSRHLKEWKDRWMVLTKTHLYSFVHKGEYKDPTQQIYLRDVQTLKSYYKDQHKKQYIFRVQSQQVKLHMSAKSNQQKWAWMTAIEKTIDRLIHPNQKIDAPQLLKQSIKMSPAVRQTLVKKQNKQPKIHMIQENIMKKMKLNIQKQIIQHLIQPILNQQAIVTEKSSQKVANQTHNVNEQQQTFFILQKPSPTKKQKVITQKNQHQKLTQANKQVQRQQPLKLQQNITQPVKQQNSIPQQQTQQKNQQNIKLAQNKVVDNQKVDDKVETQKKQMGVQQKIVRVEVQKIIQVPVPVQKIVQVQVQKIIQVPVPVQKIIQKIVKIPEIKQIIVQKIVYKDKVSSNQEGSNLLETLKQFMLEPGDNPTPLVNFIVYVINANKQKFQSEILSFCLDSQIRRFFSQAFLLILNQQIEQQRINSYLKLIILLYQACDDYFYTSDAKALITILIRQLQLNRSEYNQYLIMMTIYSLVSKSWWSQLNYRTQEIKAFIQQIQKIGCESNKALASNILQIL